MKEKTYVQDIERNIYDFKDEEKDAYRINAGLTPEIVEKLSKEKNDPAWMQNFRLESLQIYNNMKVPDWGPSIEGLNMDKSYAERDLNVGFSGGEKKKAEILQLLMLKPSLAILDETDSGLDVDAVRTVSAGIEEYQKRCDGSLLIITHSTKILESLSVDYTHVMIEGKIINTGDASLVDKINTEGFAEYEN